MILPPVIGSANRTLPDCSVQVAVSLRMVIGWLIAMDCVPYCHFCIR